MLDFCLILFFLVTAVKSEEMQGPSAELEDVYSAWVQSQKDTASEHLPGALQPETDATIKKEVEARQSAIKSESTRKTAFFFVRSGQSCD